MNSIERGGKPNVDDVVMVKLMMLQRWYGLSDVDLEREVANRLRFGRFLGNPEKMPDTTTARLFRERQGV